MRFARVLAAALLLVAATTAQAGILHPQLEVRLDQAPADEPISVIVHMMDQAPVAAMDADLRYAKAGRSERHRAVVEALQAVTVSQDALKADLSDALGRGGVLGYTSYWITNCAVVYALPAEIRRIAARADVDVVELNFQVELIEPVRRPQTSALEPDEAEPTRGIGVTPGLRAIRAPEVWYQLGYNGTGRLIGSCDTGVYGNHVALATRWRGYQNAHPWQECWLDVLGGGTTFPADSHGHGTHTTGTMAGLGATTQDTIGVAWGAKWIACNAINQNVTPGFDSDIITSFQWFADPDGNPNTIDDVPDVVQNSWGINEGFSQTPPYTDCDSRWWNVIDNCEAAGVVTCWSAGNEGPTAGSHRSPADRATSLTNCFSVGAVSAQSGQSFPYTIASFSSRGPSGCNVPADQKIKPEVCAPGVNVYSSVNSGGYQDGWDGTSMAGPHAAGIVALIRQANPNLDVVTIKQIMLDTARDEGTAGDDNTYGRGFVDAHAAVIAATVGFGEISGHVFNASWGDAPIPGARVELIESGAYWTTNGLGEYSGSAAAGDYHAEATMLGFAPAQVEITVTQNGSLVQDFYLTDNAGPNITDVSQPGSTTDEIGPYVIDATITDLSTVASALLYFRVNEGVWQSQAMNPQVGNVYRGTIPGQIAGSRIDYYIRATDGSGRFSVNPLGAPGSFYSLFITSLFFAYDAEEDDTNWMLGMAGDAATLGLWIRDDPVGTNYNGVDVQPEDDHTAPPGVRCFVTGNGPVGGAAGEADVDGGCTSLRSPVFDLSLSEQAFVSYWRWYGEAGNSTDDEFAVDVSNDGGATWVAVERVPSVENTWKKVTVDIGALVPLTSQVTFRFKACDLNTAGLVEAAIDDFSIMTFTPNAESAPESGVAVATGLEQNRPNPFRAGTDLTSIHFKLSHTSPARVEIFDATGRKVRTLHEGTLTPGAHTLVWNGLDDAGHEVGAGVYFYRLQAGAYEQSRRLTIVK